MRLIIFVTLCLASVYAQLREEEELKEICQNNCNSDSCFVNYPGSCRKYLWCVAYGQSYMVYEMRCAKGTFFDRTTNICGHPQNVDCQYDKCNNATILKYKDEFDTSCRGHWICSEGKSLTEGCCPNGYAFVEGRCVEDETCVEHCHSDAKCTRPEPSQSCRMYWNCTEDNAFQTVCCPPNQAYNKTLEQCVDDPSCNKSCEGDICTVSAVQGNNKMFMEGGEYKNCPKGTMFDQDACNCIRDPNYVNGDCEPTVEIDFMSEETKDGRAYVYYQPQHLANGSGIGNFDGHSHLEVPYFLQGKDMDMMFVHMEFKAENTGPDFQILFSNCQTDKTNAPSLEVVLNRPNEVILVSAQTYNETNSIQIKYEPGQWNEFEFEFDGTEIKARIIPEIPDALAVYDERAILSGKLIKPSRPLSFGVCDVQGVGDDRHFNGEMRNINVYTKCVPDTAGPEVNTVRPVVN